MLGNIAWLNLIAALDQKLQAEIPALLVEVNASFRPDVPIDEPVAYEQGISVEILSRLPSELPVLASFIYERIPARDGEEMWSVITYPYIIEVYLAGSDKTELASQAVKWGIALSEFMNRHGNSLLVGYSTTSYPRTDSTYVLKKRDGYRQLVTAAGNLRGPE